MIKKLARIALSAAFIGFLPTAGLHSLAVAQQTGSPLLSMAQAASSQATSCQGWHNTCLKRCQETLPGDASCPRNNCAPKLSACRSTGCWQEGRAYGGGKVCGLVK